MTKNIGSWNRAILYPNCNKIQGKLAEYSTEEMLYGEPLEIQVRNHFNSDYVKMDDLESNILIRVTASHGLTRNQLDRFFTLQGLSYSQDKLDEKLYKLVKCGYLTLVRLWMAKSGKEVFLYEITNRGLATIKQNEMPRYHPTLEYLRRSI